MPYKWKLCPLETELAKRLADGSNVHPVVGHLLVNRGVRSVEEARKFLDRRMSRLHDPEELPGVREAADRIHAAARLGKSICIYGDYDVDGMCASAILIRCLREGGSSPRFYVPDRIDEGYGVNSAALEKLRSEGVDLVVTVDCGITSASEAEFARSIGLEYIVTDHHEYSEKLPPADVVVHPRPRSAESKNPFGDLCGAGVAFELAWQIARRFSSSRKTTPSFQQFLLDSMSLVALGSVCDVVPLAGENRVLVHHGLASLKQSPPLGLASMMQITGLDSKPKLNASDFGYVLGPRLNACGRLGQARLGVELLVTTDPNRARELAEYLEEENKVRQTLERRILAEAKAMAEERYDFDEPGACSAIVLSGEDWHAGVIGIVASRLVDRYHRPCVLISLRDGQGTGSARSIEGFHLQEALRVCGDHLITSGGHAMAAGLRIEPEKLEAFRESLEEYAASRLSETDLVSEIRVDVEVPLGVLNQSLVKSLEVLEPFGASNPEPLMLATDLFLTAEPKCVGGGDRHLSFRVKQSGEARGRALRAIAFGMGDRKDELTSSDGKCCVVFSPTINFYNGYSSVELRVKDFRAGSGVTG